jgi:hypothetical protein
MAKKNFSGGIDSLFTSPKSEEEKKPDAVSDENEVEQTRTTLIVNIDTYEKIKAIAYWERKAIKDIVEKSFNLALNLYTSEEVTQMLESYKKDGT